MKKIGYIRVSSESQNLKRQLQQLNEIGMDIIYQEKISGATVDRKELQKMLEKLKPGDTIFVTDLQQNSIFDLHQHLLSILLILNAFKSVQI